MNTLDYIYDKFKLERMQVRMPIEIPDFNRERLASLFADLDFKVGAEIGVEQGLYSEMLCQANPGLKLYCVDSWQAYRGYREHVSQNKLDEFFKLTQLRLARFNCVFVRDFSLEAVKLFKPNSLDFVYIDANHDFRHVVDDISEWSKIVRPGGIVAGHDYCKRKNSSAYTVHVVEAVGGYTAAYAIRPWFVLGRRAVIEGEIRERPRSWMWVKR